MSREEEIQVLRDLINQLDDALIPEVKAGMKAMRAQAKLKGYIMGFMTTYEGFNAEYGTIGDFNWNCPDGEAKEKLKEKLKLIFEKELKRGGK